ncbi:MAG: pantoate--beta-alanine ligase [Spirochaetes bacterium GWF1_51_8]|nr:MAG: pantoate--beta-alanine ligase [Spirochaetes bacterium GWF1_51_8]
MQVVETIREIREISRNICLSGKKLGFVPTMGALHEGHISLVKNSRAENDFTAVSIFVNPTQFAPNEDYAQYPRTFDNDKSLLEQAGCDYLFFPSPEEMYGQAGTLTWVTVDLLPNHLCGISRPNHFRGVTTVVAKFLNIVQPARAYFGQKDYQQTVIIRRMAADLNFTSEIRVMPIVRETDGLAMSSRNRYLTPAERKNSLVLVETLDYGEKLIAGGETDAPAIVGKMKKLIAEKVPSAKIDYVSVVHPETLEELGVIDGKCVIALAVYIGTTRLIDNAIVG